MRKIRIAQIGTSMHSHGNNIIDSLKKQTDMFEVAGYVLPENEWETFPERRNSFEGMKELTLDEILNDPTIEAVTVENEEIHLTKYALMAAEHKKHIHMEKPGGVGLADFEKLIATVKKNGTVFHTGYMYRYNPYVIELMEQIKNGELGDIISVDAQMNCIRNLDTRQWLEKYPGGMMFYLGCHLVDLILSIRGKPDRIIPLNKCSGVEGVTSEDFGMAIFEYKNGVSFAKTSAVEYGGFERRQLVVTGSKKTVELRPFEWYTDGGKQFTERYVRESPIWGAETKAERCEPFDRYDGMMRSFGEMVLGLKKNPWDYDYELELYKTVLEACGVKA